MLDYKFRCIVIMLCTMWGYFGMWDLSRVMIIGEGKYLVVNGNYAGGVWQLRRGI